MSYIETFLKDRNEAFIKAVMEDDWKAVRKYCKKYHVPVPSSHKVFKAGIYKAVQGCNDIPAEVKGIAFKKCIELGFSPLIDYKGDE